MYSKGLTLLYVLQIFAGVLSFVASSALVVMVGRLSPFSKLRSSKHRILFFIGISDAIQSLAAVIGPFVTPPRTQTGWRDGQVWNNGNQSSCDFQGFLTIFGGTMVAIYLLALCIYYVHKVKFGVEDKDFAVKTERYLHALAVSLSLGTSILYLCLGYYNNFPDGNMCVVIEAPYGCLQDPEIKCERGEHAKNLVFMLTFIPIMVICLAIHYYLGSLFLFVKKNGDKQRRRFNTSIMRRSAVTLTTHITRIEEDAQRDEHKEESEFIQSLVSRLRRGSMLRQNTTSSQNATTTSLPGTYVTRAERRAKELEKQTFQQASMYVGAYLSVYTLPLFMNFVWYRRGLDHPLALSIVTHTIYPLQGFFNVMVYIRPNVISVRRKNPKISLFRVAWEVLKAGGEMPPQYARMSLTTRRSIRLSRRRSGIVILE